MIDTEKLVREAKEEGKVEAAIGIIKMFMRMGMTLEASFSETIDTIQISPDSIQRLKEELKLK